MVELLRAETALQVDDKYLKRSTDLTDKREQGEPYSPAGAK